MSTLRNRPTPKIPLTTTTARKIVYPDCDGEPMSDNTLQFEWISLLKWELDALFADDPEVFVAGDLLWYPVEGDNKTRMAPDAMVAFGARKGYRGSYKQWEEGFPPQVVFEVLSPGNRKGAMERKFRFYEAYGVEEYYLYNPDSFHLSGWLWNAQQNRLALIDPIDGFTSPRLGVRFDAPSDRELIIRRPDGSPFKTPLEIRAELARAEAGEVRLAAERDKATAERDKATAERDKATTERDETAQRNALLAAKLRELGIDPETLKGAN